MRSVKQSRLYRPKWRVVSTQSFPLSVPQTARDETEDEQSTIRPYVIATLMVAVLTGVLWETGNLFTLVNVGLMYLLPVLFSAVRFGLKTSIYAAGLCVISFDFFFVPPIFTYTVGDIRYLISFAVYLTVAISTAGLASQLRKQAQEAMQRESVMSVLYSLSRQVAAFRDLDSVLEEIASHGSSTFHLPIAIALPDGNGTFTVRARHGFEQDGAPNIESNILAWVFAHGQAAGYGSYAHRDASLLYVPLKTESKVYGVMCIGPNHYRNSNMMSHRLRVIEALAGLAAVSIARIQLEEEAKLAHLTAESERLRTALLDSISHELRTPIATILGAVTGMTTSAELLTVDDRQELLQTIKEGAMRLNRLVTNLLGMVRLESGMLRLNKRWCDVSDIIGVALSQVQETLQNRSVKVTLQPGLPAIAVDDVLIEQVLVNLLSNAAKYSADGSEIGLDVMEYDGVLSMQIKDQGIGIRAEESERIFEKFYRSSYAQHVPGTGLGLAICKGVIQAHDGEISARPATPKGTIITIRLPVSASEELLDE